MMQRTNLFLTLCGVLGAQHQHFWDGGASSTCKWTTPLHPLPSQVRNNRLTEALLVRSWSISEEFVPCLQDHRAHVDFHRLELGHVRVLPQRSLVSCAPPLLLSKLHNYNSWEEEQYGIVWSSCAEQQDQSTSHPSCFFSQALSIIMVTMRNWGMWNTLNCQLYQRSVYWSIFGINWVQKDASCLQFEYNSAHKDVH